MNRIARITAIAISVRAAFLDSGGWKAGTPVAIASVPVRATAPEAKARSRISTVTLAAVSFTAATDSGDGTGPVSPMNRIRMVPIPIMRNADTRNR